MDRTRDRPVSWSPRYRGRNTSADAGKAPDRTRAWALRMFIRIEMDEGDDSGVVA